MEYGPHPLTYIIYVMTFQNYGTDSIHIYITDSKLLFKYVENLSLIKNQHQFYKILKICIIGS